MKWIFCRSPAKVQKFILPITGIFMLDVRGLGFGLGYRCQVRVRIDINFCTLGLGPLGAKELSKVRAN